MKDRPEQYRYELKYVLDPLEQDKLFAFLYTHPAGFIRSYPDRMINNIYFDDVNFSACNDNLFGISDRIKKRYRWYGDSGGFDRGVLEKKIKHNTLGTKEYFELKSPMDLRDLTEQVNTLNAASRLFPSLQNSYKRSYFVDGSGKFRMTIDRELAYHYPSYFLSDMSQASYKDDRVIIELKFAEQDHDLFDIVSSGIPFRLSKHSKYVTGLLALVY